MPFVFTLVVLHYPCGLSSYLTSLLLYSVAINPSNTNLHGNTPRASTQHNIYTISVAIMSLLTYILTLLGLVTSALSLSLPLHTSSRWILDSDNQRVKLRCVNWAGHMETHLPEGLHKQSIDYLASWIAQQGFNCVRLTYSIDYALNPTLKVSDAFAQAAAPAGVSAQSMADLYTQAESKNPFLVNATTQDVYGAVVDTLWSRGVMTVMDNHVSKASWCCNLTDGNGWWKDAFGYNPENSRYFDTANWLAGLNATAAWAQGHEGVVAMSLRNEIRQFLLQGLDGPYDDVSRLFESSTLFHDVPRPVSRAPVVQEAVASRKRNTNLYKAGLCPVPPPSHSETSPNITVYADLPHHSGTTTSPKPQRTYTPSTRTCWSWSVAWPPPRTSPQSARATWTPQRGAASTSGNSTR